MTYQKLRFYILIGLVAISGFSQGMLLPVIAVIFEQSGVSSGLNGLNATALYIGILLASPFMEQFLRKFGYKPLIIYGALTMIVAFLLFPLIQSFWFWFLLRLIIGIGDHTLHFSTQTWITAFTEPKKRGRTLSIYGLAYGIGFATGPLLTTLVEIHLVLPFIISSALCLFAWVTAFLLKNEYPDSDLENASFLGSISRFKKVFKYGWVAFLPPFGYGFLEASLNGNFPIYALRSGLDIKAVSIILPAFAIGSIFTQIPLGMASDRFGRKRTLQFILFLGGLTFFVAGLVQHSPIGLFTCFIIAGMLVGSTFSLGISFMADLLPRNLLPAGNLLCGIAFSLGSIAGPFFGGFSIQYISTSSFLFVISSMLLLTFVGITLFKEQSKATM